MGYSLRDVKLNQKLTFIGTIINLLGVFFIIKFTKNTIFYSENFILVIFAAILLYLFFSNLNVTRDFSSIANKTFNIYLLHAGVLSIIRLLKSIFKINVYILFEIPILILLTFIFSYLIAYIIEKKALNKKFEHN